MVRGSSQEFRVILVYLELHWTEKVIVKFLNKLEKVISLISEKPTLFPLTGQRQSIRRCVVTKQVTL